MDPKITTDLQQKFRLAFFDGDMDGATRIATDAGFATEESAESAAEGGGRVAGPWLIGHSTWRKARTRT